jgi:hypothetical protein
LNVRYWPLADIARGERTGSFICSIIRRAYRRLPKNIRLLDLMQDRIAARRRRCDDHLAHSSDYHRKQYDAEDVSSHELSRSFFATGKIGDEQ